jgi:hypothetical protein
MPDTWTITYAYIGSRGTTITLTRAAVSREHAFRKAAQLLTKDTRRTGGLQLTVTKNLKEQHE